MGLLEFVDAISVHYYVYHQNLLLEEVKRVVAGRKPIWITETGWTTADQEAESRRSETTSGATMTAKAAFSAPIRPWK